MKQDLFSYLNYFPDVWVGPEKIGSLDHRLPELIQVHKKIELFEYDKQAISDSYAQLYNKGLSLADISKQTGKAKSAIRDNLIKAGVELRDKVAVPISSSVRYTDFFSTPKSHIVCHIFKKSILMSLQQADFIGFLVFSRVWGYSKTL